MFNNSAVSELELLIKANNQKLQSILADEKWAKLDPDQRSHLAIILSEHYSEVHRSITENLL